MESQIGIEELSFGKSTTSSLYQLVGGKAVNLYREEFAQAD